MSIATMGKSDVVVNYAHRFAPAAPEEQVVFGACSPGWHSAATQSAAVREWISFMQDRGIQRVCCLQTGTTLGEPTANVGMYRKTFGADDVLHAPIPDNNLADRETLEGEILPFLETSDARDAPVVVQGLAGIGRTGQVLAAWLVSNRGYDPREAVDAVRETGREPREAVRRGNASLQDLRQVLKRVK